MSDERDGLIAAYRLDGRGGAEPLDWAAVRRWRGSDGPLWLHLDYGAASAQRWLREASGLGEVAVAALLAEETRPRSEVMDGGLLVTLRGVNTNPGADPEDMVSIRLWFDGERIISTRRRRLLSVEDLRGALGAGTGPCSPAAVVVQLADRLVSRMSEVIGAIDESVAELEEAVLSAESRTLRPALADLRRQAILLRRYLAPQREALFRLHSDGGAWFTDIDRARLREVADKITRYLEELDAARERAALTAEELASRQAEVLNRRMYVLSLAAAVFLPLGFLTGLLGINVGGLPGVNNPHAFWEVVALIAAVIAVQFVLFKWKRWL